MIRSFTNSTVTRIKHSLASITMLVAPCTLAQAIVIDTAQIDQRILQILEDARIPGLSLAITNNGRTVFYGTYGVASTGSDSRINTQTVFEAASLTKPVIAYCALKMASQDLLDLDRPLYSYLPYKDAAHDERYRAITARRVLSHTSGFPNWRSDRTSDTLNILFEPGSKFGYSGEGFVYLQKVMEKVLGTDLNAIANRYVFEPLEMARSSLVFNYEDNFALGHDKKSKPRKKGMPKDPNAAYSLHTTAGDYAKFVNELIGPRFISLQWRNQMITPQSTMKADDPVLSWGLGVGLNSIDTEHYIWHWGDNGVFRAFFIASVDSGLGFVYFANSENGLGVVRKMIELVFSNPEIMGTWKEYEQF